MGLLSAWEQGLRIEDFVLVKQSVSAATVDLDMEWWAEKQVDLFETKGIEPWQTSCWAHTHPPGLARPSSVDEETMRSSFGGWDFALMVILTQDGQTYSRLDCDHTFGEHYQRLRVPCRLTVDWGSVPVEPVSQEVFESWKAEFHELVAEDDLMWPETPSRKNRNNGARRTHRRPFNDREEENHDAEIWEPYDIDPARHSSFDDWDGLECEPGG